MFHQRFRNPHHFEDHCLTLRANARSEFRLVADQHRNPWFGKENIEFRADTEDAIFESLERWRNVGTAEKVDRQSGVAPDIVAKTN